MSACSGGSLSFSVEQAFHYHVKAFGNTIAQIFNLINDCLLQERRYLIVFGNFGFFLYGLLRIFVHSVLRQHLVVYVDFPCADKLRESLRTAN